MQGELSGRFSEIPCSDEGKALEAYSARLRDETDLETLND